MFDAKPNILMGTLIHKQALPAFGLLAWEGYHSPVRKMGNRHLKWSLIIHDSRVTAIKNIRLLGSKALVFAFLTLAKSIRAVIQGKLR